MYLPGKLWLPTWRNPASQPRSQEHQKVWVSKKSISIKKVGNSNWKRRNCVFGWPHVVHKFVCSKYSSPTPPAIICSLLCFFFPGKRKPNSIMPWGSRILWAYITNHPSRADADAPASADHSKTWEKKRHGSNKKSIKTASTYYLHAPQICLSAAVVVVVVISGSDMPDASRYHHMAYTTSILLYKSCTSLAQMTFFNLWLS